VRERLPETLDSLYETARPALFRLDAEIAHDRILGTLARISQIPELPDLLTIARGKTDLRLAMQAFGAWIPLPLGIAAGLDKNAAAFPALLALGFGHVEIGTVTPRPQAGNPRPRVFRLPEDRGLINRMGFPSEGVAAVVSNLATLHRQGMIVGCNIGPNRQSVEQGTVANDLVAAYRAVAATASYVAINVSSPNTEGLRAFQDRSALEMLLDAVNDERNTLTRRPLLLKISPDLSDRQLVELLDVALARKIDGIIATNTTITRPSSLRSPMQRQPGGLSGTPLAPLAARTVHRIAFETGRALPIVAVGGIETAEDVLTALALGATTTQTYTGFVYRGPGMALAIARGILAELDRRRAPNLESLVEELRAERRQPQ
jgi:dihydroorotate dehydrogenase